MENSLKDSENQGVQELAPGPVNSNFMTQSIRNALGFWLSFVAFSLHIFIPKISQFFFSKLNLTLVFCCMVAGISLGAFTATQISIKRFKIVLVIFCLSLPAFLMSLALYNNFIFFHLMSTALLIPLGVALGMCFNESRVLRFYLFELLGGITGLIYSLFLIDKILIETSFGLITLISMAFTSWILFKNKYKQPTTVVILLLIIPFTLFQEKYQTLNFLKITSTIPFPKNQGNQATRNGHEALKKGYCEFLRTNWSLTERIDLLKCPKNHTLYYDNKSYSGISNFSTRRHRYFDHIPKKDAYLSIGPGGGSELISAKVAGFEKIYGVEINSAVINIMKEAAAGLSDNIYNEVTILNSEGRSFLEQTHLKFDLITSYWVDYQNSSVDGKGTKDLLRTQEGVASILNALTPQGIAVWKFKIVQGKAEEEVKNIVKSLMVYFSKGGFDPLSRIYLGLREKIIRHEAKPSFHLLVFASKDSVSKESFKNISESLMIERFAFSKIDEASEEILKPFKDIALNIESHRISLKDDRPFLDPQKLSSNIKSVLLFLLAFIVLVSFLIFMSVYRNKQSASSLSLISLGFLSGINIGLIQTSLVNKIEVSFESYMISYSLGLLVFMVGHIVGVVISKGIEFKKSFYIYYLIFAPLLIVMGMGLNYFDLNMALILILILISLTSAFFPQVLKNLNDRDKKMTSTLYGYNLLGFSLGTFLFFLSFVVYGFEDTLVYSLGLLFGVLLIMTFLYRLVVQKS